METPASPYFVPAHSGHLVRPFDGIEIRTTSGSQMMLSVVHLESGAVVTEHSHPHEQMGILISGRLEFTIGGETRVLEPGDIWNIPGNVAHRVVAVGGPAVALDCFHPVREDYA